MLIFIVNIGVKRLARSKSCKSTTELSHLSVISVITMGSAATIKKMTSGKVIEDTYCISFL
jgi:hypothetical protein